MGHAGGMTANAFSEFRGPAATSHREKAAGREKERKKKNPDFWLICLAPPPLLLILVFFHRTTCWMSPADREFIFPLFLGGAAAAGGGGGGSKVSIYVWMERFFFNTGSHFFFSSFLLSLGYLDDEFRESVGIFSWKTGVSE